MHFWVEASVVCEIQVWILKDRIGKVRTLERQKENVKECLFSFIC